MWVLYPSRWRSCGKKLVLQRHRNVLHSTEDGVLNTHLERVDAREEGRSGGRAHRQHVGVFQHHSFRSHLVDVGRVHFAVSKPNIIPPHVVGHDDQDVGSVWSLFSRVDEEADEEDSKSKSVSHLTTACHCDDSLKARDSYSHVLLPLRRFSERTWPLHTRVKMRKPVMIINNEEKTQIINEPALRAILEVADMLRELSFRG